MAGWQRWCPLVALMSVLVCGAQTQTCNVNTLLGIDPNTEPQSSQSPFLLTVSPSRYNPLTFNGNFKVKITSALDASQVPFTFKGIFLQVRVFISVNDPVGNWRSDLLSNEYTLQTCAQSGDTIIQANSNDKLLPVEFEWIRPTAGSFEVIATIVHSDGIYWGGHTALIIGETGLEGISCSVNPCNQGLCWSANNGNGYFCQCGSGYEGTSCETLKQSYICNDATDCSVNGACFESASNPGKFACICNSGYTGPGCHFPDLCMSNPCDNGGACSVQGSMFTCLCPPGYTGDICNVIVTTATPEITTKQSQPCDSNPCQNGGSCVEANSKYTCMCPSDFQGANCDDTVVPDPCSPNPCNNGGACSPQGSTFECACQPGYMGDTCDLIVTTATPEITTKQSQPCDSNPCQNGGSCVEANTQYTCMCPSDFQGENCDEIVVPVNPCDPNPCQNGGTCTPSGNTVVCACPDTHTGPMCGTDVPPANPCDPNPCQNGGICTPSGNTVVCACPDTHTGPLCGTEVPPANPCDPNPCQNGGTCTPSGNTAICTCTDTHTGPMCGTDVPDPCSPDPCNNGGACSPQGGTFECACQPGYMGDTCDMIECTEGVTCKNGGTCSASLTKICNCPTSFTGDFCEGKGSSCPAGYCENGATCLARNGVFTCVCPNFYNGTKCSNYLKPNDTLPQELPLEIWWIALLALVGLLLVIIIISIIFVVCRSSAHDEGHHRDGNRKPYA